MRVIGVLGWVFRRRRFGRPVTDLREVAAHSRGLLPAEMVPACHYTEWRRAMDELDAELGTAVLLADPIIADTRRAVAQGALGDFPPRTSFAALVGLGGSFSPTTPIRSRRGCIARVLHFLL